MKSSRGLLRLLVFLYLGFAGFVLGSLDQLPGRVATHFDGQGRPNGWMSRPACVAFSLVLGSVFPLVAVVVSRMVGRLPAQGMNLPQRDYWNHPQRLESTRVYLQGHVLIFGGLGLVFMAGIHALILQANRPGAGGVSLPWLLAVAGGFVVAVGLWAVRLIRHFLKVPPGSRPLI